MFHNTMPSIVLNISDEDCRAMLRRKCRKYTASLTLNPASFTQRRRGGGGMPVEAAVEETGNTRENSRLPSMPGTDVTVSMNIFAVTACPISLARPMSHGIE